MITVTEKTEIRNRLEEYCVQKGSQNKAANSLNDVSAATISKLLNNEWELINETMWRYIANQIGIKQKSWNIVETENYLDLTQIFSDAQEDALVMALCGNSGTGKTLAANHYAGQKREVYYLSCNDYWNRRIFLQEMLRVMRKPVTSDMIGEMMSDIIRHLKRADQPLIILDEADKLSDNVLYFFISIYNEVEDCCGLILMATDFFEKRIKRGLRLNKKGYKEIYSRIGGNCIPLRGLSYSDVVQICMANGVTDKKEIKEAYEDCNGDIRRLKRKCYALNKKRNSETDKNEKQ
jgi:DNA transposition AAA+ family ATPase